MRSWSVPKAAMEPIRPLRTATQTMLGLVKIRLQNSGAPGAGPQLITFSRPASYAVWSTAPAPPSMRETRKPRVTAPATRNMTAWKTLVHTTAFTPPVAM